MCQSLSEAFLKTFSHAKNERHQGSSACSSEMGDLSYPSILVFLLLLLFFFLENAGEEEKRQFLQEIDLMKDVGSHPNILSIFGFWVRSEPIMLIMEYVPHGDLLQWLRNKRQQVKLVYINRFLPFSRFRILTFGIHFTPCAVSVSFFAGYGSAYLHKFARRDIYRNCIRRRSPHIDFYL